MQQFSTQALMVLKTVLSFTGEKEPDEKGQEKWTPRSMWGENQAQRRHFNKKYDPINEVFQEKIKKVQEDYNAEIEKKRVILKKANKIKKDEKEDAYDLRINSEINKDKKLAELLKKFQADVEILNTEKHEIELTDKTIEVIKECYADFGEKKGFVEAEDEICGEIDEVLK